MMDPLGLRQAMPSACQYTGILLLLLTVAVNGAFAATDSSIHTSTRAQNDSETRNFQIPTTSLAKAMVQFVLQAGVGVLAEDNVDTALTIKPIQGLYSPRAALDKMLQESGLVAEASASGYYVIRRMPNRLPSPITTPVMEEIVITGTHIKGALAPSPNPVKVIGRNELAANGSPSMIDLVANLPSVSGTENQSNQFHNVYAAGTANINLRGLGVSRTLVLLNGKRMAPSALPHNDGQTFVDINTIPALALEQVDILKDGAGTTYGSDALAGVVNFITRRDFQGLELHTSAKYIDESNGDWDLGLLAGHTGNALNWLGAVTASRRSELRNSDREEITHPRADIASTGQTVYGISSIGNPGSFIPIDAATAADGVTEMEAAAAGGGNRRTNYVRDPNCEAVGGIPLSAGRCGFGYVPFDNLVEEETRWQAFSTWEIHLSEMTDFYAEIHYAYRELPEWKTSPSYPPLKEADPNRYIPPEHPGLVDFLARHPGIATAQGTPADFSGGAIFVGRPIGVTGPVETGVRQQESYRLLSGIDGEWNSGLNYDISFAYSANLAKSRTPDALTHRWQAALQGFGGPQCSGSLPGRNGCLYYNPFSSAIPGSPDFDPALANSPQLLRWLKEDLVQNNSTDLAVVDTLFSGTALDAPEGNFKALLGTVDYAFGFQYRKERLKIRFNDLANVVLNPGEVTENGELPGLFIFFRGGFEDDVSQDVIALFGELMLRGDEDLSVQLALRYENYGEGIGHSLDPKLAVRWKISPQWALRASASTSFRAPSLNQTSLDTTALELIGAAFAFKAVNRIGNPNLKPEQALTSNLGIIWEPDAHWRLNMDYWRFDVSDVIVQESANAIVNNVLANPDSVWASQVIFDAGGNISRILSRYVNGPDVLVEGVDMSGEYRAPAFAGTLSLGLDAAYLHRYDVGRSELMESFSAQGRLNTGTFVKALPRWQGNVYLNYALGGFNSRLVLNGIGSYKDDGLDIFRETVFENLITEKEVEAFYSTDMHFTFRFPAESTSLNFSILNVADREPPTAREDMRFDTTLHNAFGRMVKLGVNHRF